MDKVQSSALPLGSGAFAGVGDIVASFRRTALWLTLGWYDFTVRYRQTLIGPLWQTLIMAIWVSGLGYLFTQILHRAGHNYIAYLAAGLILWNYISGTLTASTQVFVKNSKLIFSVNIPMYVYVLRQITENVTRLAFQSLVFVAVLFVSDIHIGPRMLLAIPGMAMLLFTSLWLVPLMGMLGARFRDLAFALSSIMRFLFFTTPVFWRASGLGERAYLANFNPFAHFLAVVRAPLLGEPAGHLSWIVVFVISVVGAIVTLFAYTRFRQRIVFWL